jgi:hypothetical protein
MIYAILFPMIHVLYFYVSTFRSTYAVPNQSSCKGYRLHIFLSVLKKTMVILYVVCASFINCEGCTNCCASARHVGLLENGVTAP